MSQTQSETRLDRAASIDADDVNFVGQQKAEVQSQSDPDTSYTVDVQEASCTCPDHVYRGTTCKHLGRVAELTGVIDLPDN
jgi:uncharacterized Zn finger protein